MNVIENLIAQAKQSIAEDPDGENTWDRSRLFAFTVAKNAKPENLKSWAIEMLAAQEEYAETAANSAQSEADRQMITDLNYGVLAGLHEIIDELCAQEAHHDPVRA